MTEIEDVKIVTVFVAEEDYKYDLSDLTPEQLAEVKRDVNNLYEYRVWRELWLVSESYNQCMDWQVHEILGRTYLVILDE